MSGVVFRDPYAVGLTPQQRELALNQANMTPTRLTPRDSRSLPAANRLGNRSVSSDSVYTILIRLPGKLKD